MAPTEPVIGAPLAAAELADAASAGARGRLESGCRRLGDVPRARDGFCRPRGRARRRDGGDPALRHIRLGQHGAGGERTAPAWPRHQASETLHRGAKRAGLRAAARRNSCRASALSLGCGFEETWGYHRLARASTSPTREGAPNANGITVRPIANPTGRRFAPIDAAAFGADRRAAARPAARPTCRRWNWSRNAMAASPASCSAKTAAAPPRLGPLIADDDDVAQVLLARALPAINGPIYIDFADSKTRLRKWLAESGFSEQRPLTRIGARPHAGLRRRGCPPTPSPRHQLA